MTKIEWTDTTWNIGRGCRPVSRGCERCYAERQAHRFSGPGQPYEGLTVLGKRRPRWTGQARFIPEMLDQPLRWRKPRRVFVNSMSDLFHEDITNEQIAAVFGVMAACPQHTFQILTKRPDRMGQWFRWLDDEAAFHASYREGSARDDLHVRICIKCADDQELDRSRSRRHIEYPPWPLPNVWLGCSVEDQKRADGKRQLEGLDVRVMDAQEGRDALAETFSGGEAVIVGEAVALALTALSCRRSGVERPTLVRDESGAALAPENAPAYVAMLRRAARSIGADKVLLVSHDPEVSQLCDARIVVAERSVEVL